LYDLPRGWERFRRYLEVMTGGTRDIVLPLGALNPMGKEQVAAMLDALLAIRAETIAGPAVEAARRQLAAARGALKVGRVVAGYAVATAAAHHRRLSPEAALGQHRESPRRA